MELSTLQDALSEAQQGLADVAADFELLRLQKEKLERLVASLREVLNPGIPAGSGALALASPTVTEMPRSPNTKAVWQVVQEILAAKKLPMTVPEIEIEFANLGVSSSVESIRVAMFRKPSIFVRLGHGSYGLVAWRVDAENILAAAAEKEASSEEKAS